MSSSLFRQKNPRSNSQQMSTADWTINWEDVTCPICLDFPHNGVLLQCSSYVKGCRPFMCDTDHTHSNCLERFKTANGMPAFPKMSASTAGDLVEISPEVNSGESISPTCPLCRGHVVGWIIVDEARRYLNLKKRCCEEKDCGYVGNYMELQKHANTKHPNSRPTEIDLSRKLDWENFQQSSEIIDVLSTIHSEVPRGVVFGDYVIEYGDEDTGDEYDDFPGEESNWWKSCIIFQVFGNLRASRNRRRLREAEARRRQRASTFDPSYSDEGSNASVVGVPEYRFDETDDEYVGVAGVAAASRGSSSHRSSWRRRSRFNDG